MNIATSTDCGRPNCKNIVIIDSKAGVSGGHPPFFLILVLEAPCKLLLSKTYRLILSLLTWDVIPVRLHSFWQNIPRHILLPSTYFPNSLKSCKFPLTNIQPITKILFMILIFLLKRFPETLLEKSLCIV